MGELDSLLLLLRFADSTHAEPKRPDGWAPRGGRPFERPARSFGASNEAPDDASDYEEEEDVRGEELRSNIPEHGVRALPAYLHAPQVGDYFAQRAAIQQQIDILKQQEEQRQSQQMDASRLPVPSTMPRVPIFRESGGSSLPPHASFTSSPAEDAAKAAKHSRMDTSPKYSPPPKKVQRDAIVHGAIYASTPSKVPVRKDATHQHNDQGDAEMTPAGRREYKARKLAILERHSALLERQSALLMRNTVAAEITAQATTQILETLKQAAEANLQILEALKGLADAAWQAVEASKRTAEAVECSAVLDAHMRNTNGIQPDIARNLEVIGNNLNDLALERE